MHAVPCSQASAGSSQDSMNHQTRIWCEKKITENGEKRRRLQSRSPCAGSPMSGPWRCRKAPAAPQRAEATQRSALPRPPPAAGRRHEAFAGSGPRCSTARMVWAAPRWASLICGKPGFLMRGRYPPCCLPVLFKFYLALLIALLVVGLKKRNIVFSILRFTQLNLVALLRGFLPGYMDRYPQ